MKGNVVLKFKNKNGKTIYEEKHNLVVSKAGEITADMIVNGTTNLAGLSQVVIGSDTTEPTLSTTSLGGTTLIKSLDSVSSTLNVVTCNFSFATTEFNGNDIWQFGLMDDQNNLFSIFDRTTDILTPPTISKTVEMDIEGVWTITADL